jgi:DNA-binding MarR family transcriptional regulator
MRHSKSELVDDVVREFRNSGNLDRAFDKLAAERLGVNDTDLLCLNIVENGGGVSAGELATQSGLTSGAVTGVIDRLERAGYLTRVGDPADRRRVRVQVTSAFYQRAAHIWGPVATDWQTTLGERYTAAELRRIIEFLRVTNELTRSHLHRLEDEPSSPSAPPGRRPSRPSRTRPSHQPAALL